MELRRKQSTRHTGHHPMGLQHPDPSPPIPTGLRPARGHAPAQGELSSRQDPRPPHCSAGTFYLAYFGRCVGAEHAPLNGCPWGAAVQHLRLHLPALLQVLWETPALTHLSTMELVHLCDTGSGHCPADSLAQPHSRNFIRDLQVSRAKCHLWHSWGQKGAWQMRM